MKSHYAPKLAALLRSAARYGSVATALLFGLAIAADRNMGYHVWRLVSGADPYPELLIILGLLSGAVLGGFLSWNRRLALTGVAVTTAFVVAMFAWCGSLLEISLSPFMIAMLAPSGLMLLARQLEELPAESGAVVVEEVAEAAAPQEEPALVPAASVA